MPGLLVGGLVQHAARLCLVGIVAVALAGSAWSADKDKAKKDYRVVSAKCNLDTRETSETGMGLTACRYVCEDPDKTKVSRVFMSATAVCAKTVEEKVKQLIR